MESILLTKEIKDLQKLMYLNRQPTLDIQGALYSNVYRITT